MILIHYKHGGDKYSLKFIKSMIFFTRYKIGILRLKKI